jgi:prepilin-type N-terminal cleavage/methylation domain-containing protein
MKQPTSRGFTLIELLIVVVIIGILAAIAIPKFSAVREKAYRSSMMSDLKNLATQQEIYYNDNFTYTTSLTTVGFSQSEGVAVTVNEATNTGWAATAVHSGAATNQCGVFHGNAAPSGGDPATVEGVVTCDF